MKSLMTTKEAAAYCGFKTVGALHKARTKQKVRPAGRLSTIKRDRFVEMVVRR